MARTDGVVEYEEEEIMGVALEAGVPYRKFQRRLQPFGIALAEVSWQVKMFAHDGVVLAALYLQEPDPVAAFTRWPDPDERPSCRSILRRLSGSEFSKRTPRVGPVVRLAGGVRWLGVRNVHADRLTWARTLKTDVVRYLLSRIA